LKQQPIFHQKGLNMADSEHDQQAAAAGEETGLQIHFQRFYLKDCSFESPSAPGVFNDLSQWQPQLNLNFSTSTTLIEGELREVTLKVQVEVAQAEKTLYLVEVEQAGLFTIKNCDEAQLKQLLGVYCPSMLYPYAREVVSDMVVKGGFPPLLLQPVNFDRLYKQAREQIGPAAGSA
jgi:preprotein translocase subunit SecB